MPVSVVDDPSAAGSGPTEPGGPTPDRRRSASARIDLSVIGAYVVLGVLVCVNYWVDVQHRVSSHLPTDHSWFEWLFAHGAYSVRHLENPLFSARQNFPDGVNLMANTSLLGVTLPMSPITMLFGPQVAYSLYLGAALAGTGATAYWVLRRGLVRSRAAAALGGGFLGFAPGVIHHANGQPNFASNFLLPLIVGQVVRLGRPGQRRVRNGLLLGLTVTYQVFINEEMLLLTALACAVVVVAYGIQRPADLRSRLLPAARTLAVGGGLALLLVAYPLWFQFNGPQSYRGLQGGVFHNWGEDVAAFVTFARDTVAGGPAVEKTIGTTEQNTWLGWPLVILVLLAVPLLWRRSVAARVAAVLVAVFGVLSLGPSVRLNTRDTGLYGVWHYLPDDLPLVEMMMPTRLSLVLVAAVGVLVALAWDQLAAAPRDGAAPARGGGAADDIADGRDGEVGGRRGRVGRPWRLAGYTAISLALVPLLPEPLPAKHVDSPPHFITAGGWRPYVPAGRSLVPVPLPNNVQGLATLRWSALTGHEFPVPGGYFIGPGPSGEGIFGTAPRPTAALIYQVSEGGTPPPVGPDQRAQALADLRYWRASVVVLGDHPHSAELRTLVTELIGPGRRVDDVWLWDVRSLVG